jgi:hypothetical protein
MNVGAVSLGLASIYHFTVLVPDHPPAAAGHGCITMIMTDLAFRYIPSPCSSEK